MTPPVVAKLIRMNVEPKEAAAYAHWLQQDEIVPFLENETYGEDIVVMASLTPHVFIHGILIPTFEPDSESMDRLLKWNFNATSSWSMVGSLENVTIGGPLDSTSSPLIRSGEMIVYQRSFEGVHEKSRYFELNQKVAQVLGLHYMEEREAWCDLNRFGDIDEIVKVHRIDQPAPRRNGAVITMRRSRLAEYAGAGGFVLLRMFDFTRYRSESFSGWGERTETQLADSDSVYGSLSDRGRTGSYSRGVQIVDLASTQEELLEQMCPGEEEKDYSTYIAHDWRHKQVGEFSCAPDRLANYFVPSDDPFATSPAFFRPEVLSKYKADTDQYEIEYRSITCRGGWYLKSFGVNEAGQVHAYLGDLGDLPYEEQLHWKQFNEAPKAGLSQSVITTDFHGEWDDEYEPLMSLKQRLEELHFQPAGWWILRDERLPTRVHYPFTDSRDEWGCELMNLDQLLVEGLVVKWLRAKAKELGREPDDRLRALKLLEECLIGLSFESGHARELMSPWHEVHNLRSVLKGHASGDKPREQESIARKAHGNLVGHFRFVCTECDESLRAIAEAFAD